jgi:hypothetical protein
MDGERKNAGKFGGCSEGRAEHPSLQGRLLRTEDYTARSGDRNIEHMDGD